MSLQELCIFGGGKDIVAEKFFYIFDEIQLTRAGLKCYRLIIGRAGQVMKREFTARENLREDAWKGEKDSFAERCSFMP